MVRLEGRNLLWYEFGLTEKAVQVGLAPELDDPSFSESVGLDSGHGEIPAAAVVGVGERESHGHSVAGREEVVYLYTAVGQSRSQHRSLGIVPPLAVNARAVNEDVFGDELLELGDLFRLEDPKVAADDLGIALAEGFC